MSSFPAKTGEQPFVLLNEIFKPDSSFHGGKGLITLLISGLSSSLRLRFPWDHTLAWMNAKTNTIHIIIHRKNLRLLSLTFENIGFERCPHERKKRIFPPLANRFHPVHNDILCIIYFVAREKKKKYKRKKTKSILRPVEFDKRR